MTLFLALVVFAAVVLALLGVARAVDRGRPKTTPPPRPGPATAPRLVTPVYVRESAPVPVVTTAFRPAIHPASVYGECL